MNKLNYLRLSSTSMLVPALSAMACAWGSPAWAQTEADLVGAWEETVAADIDDKSTKTYSFGQHSTGRIMFDGSGHFILVMGDTDVPKFESNNRAHGTAEENRAAVAGSLSIFGAYSVIDNVVNLSVDYSSYPNWSGTNQRRIIVSSTADEITWTFVANGAGLAEATWRRVK